MLSLKGTDHHQAALDAIRSGDGATAEAEIVADIEEAAAYLLSLRDSTGLLQPAPASRIAGITGPRSE